MNRSSTAPTITIREGHRVRVYVTSDRELPWVADVRDGGRPEGR